MRNPERKLRALVVENNASLATTLKGVLAEFASPVTIALSVQEATVAIQTAPPELVLLDFALEDGTALEILEALHNSALYPKIIVITGEAESEESFQLAQRGVRAFIRKPCSLAKLRETIESVLTFVPDPLPEVRAAVGQQSIDEIEDKVRTTMVHEAMRKSNGNIRAAASLLGISRQRLQYILRVHPIVG